MCIRFNSSKSGYITSEDTALTVKNVYDNSLIKIVSVKCDGIDIEFDAALSKPLLPGESVDVSFTGDLPEVTAKGAVITVEYIKLGVLSSVSSADFAVMVDNK